MRIPSIGFSDISMRMTEKIWNSSKIPSVFLLETSPAFASVIPFMSDSTISLANASVTHFRNSFENYFENFSGHFFKKISWQFFFFQEKWRFSMNLIKTSFENLSWDSFEPFFVNFLELLKKVYPEITSKVPGRNFFKVPLEISSRAPLEFIRDLKEFILVFQ